MSPGLGNRNRISRERVCLSGAHRCRVRRDHLRAAVVILDVGVPDPDDPDNRAEDYTHTVWKCGPDYIGTSHAYGIVATAAHAMLMGGEAE
jgi:hypothetical protein